MLIQTLKNIIRLEDYRKRVKQAKHFVHSSRNKQYTQGVHKAQRMLKHAKTSQLACELQLKSNN